MGLGLDLSKVPIEMPRLSRRAFVFWAFYSASSALGNWKNYAFDKPELIWENAAPC